VGRPRLGCLEMVLIVTLIKKINVTMCSEYFLYTTTCRLIKSSIADIPQKCCAVALYWSGWLIS
jgi:hypothetical protein